MKTTENKETGKIREVYNLIILDRSGSMSTIASQAIAGVNETIGTIRAASRQHKEMRQFVTVTSFCGCSIKDFCKNIPVEDVAVMTPADYQPCCSTPLYDAMGRALTEMRKRVGNRRDVAVSVTVITDGYENASRQWTAPQIKALVELLSADGWLFAYIGANQDLKEISYNLSINNTMSFECDSESTAEMFAKERRARKSWYDGVASAPCMKSSMNEDYFK